MQPRKSQPHRASLWPALNDEKRAGGRLIVAKRENVFASSLAKVGRNLAENDELPNRKSSIKGSGGKPWTLA